MIRMVPRLDTLADKTVCVVSNSSFKVDVTMPAIEQELKRTVHGDQSHSARADAVDRAAGGASGELGCDPGGDREEGVPRRRQWQWWLRDLHSVRGAGGR